jgi:hypothetical protein
MKFSDLTMALEASVPGTDAFLAVKHGTHALIAEDPGRAAAWFLIYGFARNYVILHDDEPITPEFAEAAKNQLLGYMRTLESAMAHGEGSLLHAMNDVVQHYVQSNKPF